MRSFKDQTLSAHKAIHLFHLTHLKGNRNVGVRRIQGDKYRAQPSGVRYMGGSQHDVIVSSSEYFLSVSSEGEVVGKTDKCSFRIHSTGAENVFGQRRTPWGPALACTLKGGILVSFVYPTQLPTLLPFQTEKGTVHTDSGGPAPLALHLPAETVCSHRANAMFSF